MAKAVIEEIMNMLEAAPSITDQPVQKYYLTTHPLIVSSWRCWSRYERPAHTIQVKRLTSKEVKKYYKHYESYMGTKTTETLIGSFLMVASKVVGMVLPIKDVSKLQQKLQEDYIINRELSAPAGNLALRCGRLLAVDNAALITAKRLDLRSPEQEPWLEPGPEPGQKPVQEPM